MYMMNSLYLCKRIKFRTWMSHIYVIRIKFSTWMSQIKIKSEYALRIFTNYKGNMNISVYS